MSQPDDALLPPVSAPAKLTGWENEPTPELLKKDFEAARISQQTQIAKIKNWNDLLLVRGSAKPKKVTGRSSIQPKLIRRQAEWRYSALSEPFLGTNKLYALSPVTFEDSDACIQNELLLNWQFRTKMNKVNFIDDYVRSTVDDGTSITQLGWCRETAMVDEVVPVFSYYALDPNDQAAAAQLVAAGQLRAEDPTTYLNTVPIELQKALEYFDETNQLVTAIQTGEETVKVEKVVKNHPTATVLNPANVYIDPSCNGIFKNALFCIVSFETNEAEMKKYPGRYKNLDKVNWEGNTIITDADHETLTPSDFNFTDKLRKKVVAYEYWGFHDIRKDGVMRPIVATWIGDVMVRMEESPFPDGELPFVVVPYLPVKRELFGEPDAELLAENQQILGAVTRGMIDSLGRSANAQQGIAKGLLDPLNRRRYDNGQDYEFNPTNGNPMQSIIEHKYPELPQSAMLMLNLQNQEAESLTGVKSFAGGVSGESYGDVVAGIRGALDAASKREMAILRRLAQGMKEIGTKIIAMNAVFLTEEEVVRVTNTQFVTVRREDLPGNFDMEVDISTAEVDNQKSQDLGFMLQTLGPNSDPSFARLILSEIARLKRMPELAHQIENFKPQPDPMDQRLKELEIAKAEAEVAEIQARTQKALAEARRAASMADNADLDFVEQETGTKHAREMEKQRAQATGNQDLEVTKALLAKKKPGESEPNIEAAIGYNALSQLKDNAGQI